MPIIAAPFHWDLPKGFPPPNVPPTNPMSEAKVHLGRYLFYDKRLSVNGSAILRVLPSAGIGLHGRPCDRSGRHRAKRILAVP